MRPPERSYKAPRRWSIVTAKARSVPEVPADPVDFARECLDFHPDPRQLQILQSGARFGIVNCTRQWGKSTLLAILSAHRALRERDSLILYIGPSARQSGELFEKVKWIFDQLGVHYEGDGRNTQSACLANGSRLVALPCAGHRLRGFSAPSMIIIDEAAYVPDNVYTILRPMLLMSRGSLWMLSTPFGKRGFFYKEWISKDAEWSRFSVPASECPRFAPAEIEREKRRLPDRVFRQELNCEFIDPEEALFPTELILRALTSDVAHLPLHTAGLFPNGFASGQ